MTETSRPAKTGRGLDPMGQSLLLMLLGGILIVLYTSGRYLWYIKASSGLILLAGGIILTITGTISAAVTVRHRAKQLRATRDNPTTEAAPVDDGHGGRSTIGWLLLAPVLVLVITPPALGADSIARTSTVAAVTPQPSPESAEPEAVSVDGSRMTMIEFIRHNIYDPDESVRDDKVTITGIIATAGHGFPDGYFIARLLITCCAADAQSVRVFVPGPAPYPPNTWVEAVVTAEPGTAAARAKAGNGYTPTGTVHAITRTDQPDDPYEQ